MYARTRGAGDFPELRHDECVIINRSCESVPPVLQPTDGDWLFSLSTNDIGLRCGLVGQETRLSPERPSSNPGCRIQTGDEDAG